MTKQQHNDNNASVRRGWINFGILAGFLLFATVGWGVSMKQLGYWLQKEPIEWPDGVEVDIKDCTNTSLAKNFGNRYKLVEGDGVLFWDKEKKAFTKDGKPDGIIEHDGDILDSLKIGTTLDTTRHKDRKSNWYSARIYEDTREPRNSPYRYWRLSIDFYTGGEITVPHVPEVCGAAGGINASGHRKIAIECPSQRDPWNKFNVKGLTFEKGRNLYVQYYLFDVNGAPELDRFNVRRILSSLTLRYVFYAKIQASPLYSRVPSVAESDRKAAEFFKYAMPYILKEFPSRETVEQLNK